MTYKLLLLLLCVHTARCGDWRVYQLVAGVYAQTRLLMTSKTQSEKMC